MSAVVEQLSAEPVQPLVLHINKIATDKVVICPRWKIAHQFKPTK